MRRKALEDAGIELPFYYEEDEKNKDRIAKDIEEYGFSRRECYNLDFAFLVWLYERLVVYKRDAEPFVDLTYYKFNINGKEYTQIEAINEMISCLEFCLKDDTVSEQHDKEEREKIEFILEAFKEVFHAMWW